MTSKDRLLLNGQRILRVLREFSFESSGDVTINYITDNDGTEETYTMWSVRKIMDNLRSVIFSNMDVTYYIDPENGDDENDGSYDNPFKTSKHALSISPFSSNVYLYILNDEEITSSTSIIMRGVSVEFRTHEDNPDSTIILNHDDVNNPIGLYKGALVVFRINIECKNTYDDISRASISMYEDSIVESFKKGDGSNQKITIDENSSFLYNRVSSAIVSSADISVSDGGLLSNVSYECNFELVSNSINGDTSPDYGDFISGIIKDADSGNPINLTSNINFSD